VRELLQHHGYRPECPLTHTPWLTSCPLAPQPNRRITGYSRKEVIGRNCRFLQGPRTDPATVQKLATALHEVRRHCCRQTAATAVAIAALLLLALVASTLRGRCVLLSQRATGAELHATAGLCA